MGSQEDLDDDDDFSELYKEYTGPVRSNANKTEITTTEKRSHAGSDEEQEERDPNAVPTDFTSREAKVWEAKSKATERNWKKRKEEELICKICGESGHFTQGCPSTLGANRKSQDFIERVPARESHVKALFTDKVVSQIENDTGCKLKIEEKFIIVSGKDRLILRKGVDAVHKIKDGSEKKGPSSPHMSKSRSPERRSPVPSRFVPSTSQRSRSPERKSPLPSRFVRSESRRSRSPERRSPVSSRFGRSDSQRSNFSPCNASQLQHRYVRHEKAVEDRVREDIQKLSRGSPQAYGNNGARARSSRSRSPAIHSFAGNCYNSYDVHSHGREMYKSDEWTADRRGSDTKSGREFQNYALLPQTLVELELEYKKDVLGLAEIRNKEEDEENLKHREAIREMTDIYMKKVTLVRETHAKQWDEFLQLEAQIRKQDARQHVSASGLGGYKQSDYPEYEKNLSADPRYPGSNFQIERYPNSTENYPSSRPCETYGDIQRQRRDDFGKAYDRY